MSNRKLVPTSFRMGYIGCCILGCVTVGCSGFRNQPAGYDPLATMDGETESTSSLLDQFHPDTIYTQTKDAIGQGVNQQLAQQLFQDAESRFAAAGSPDAGSSKRDYLKAAKLYRKAIYRSSKSKLQEDAMFMVGESYFFADRYPQAVEAFAALVEK